MAIVMILCELKALNSDYLQLTMVLGMLREDVENKLEEITGEWLEEEINPDSRKFVVRNFAKLIEKLEIQGKLPALVFRLVVQ